MFCSVLIYLRLVNVNRLQAAALERQIFPVKKLLQALVSRRLSFQWNPLA